VAILPHEEKRSLELTSGFTNAPLEAQAGGKGIDIFGTDTMSIVEVMWEGKNNGTAS